MLQLLKIAGNSLTPDYQEGDFVFVSKIPFFFSPPRAGDVVAFHHPAYGIMLKRIQSIDLDRQSMFVTGTIPDSVDSRNFGEVSTQTILGKVILRIHKPV